MTFSTLVSLVVAASGALTPAGVPPELSAQQETRRLEPAECAFAGEEWAARLKPECRWLVVPLHRGRRDTATARLFVVVLRANRPSEMPPLVSLHGGPAESALLTMVRGAARRPLPRDVVIYDQRGAGLSQPDPCPDYAVRLAALESAMPLGDDSRRALQTVARECSAIMREHKVDPAAFSTTANASDLIDLRLALGYQRWDVYGASYGARLALEAMRRDPGGIRAVVLENPKPPGAEAAEAPLATQHALERVFAACARNNECHAAFPELLKTFLAVFDTLSMTPLVTAAEEAGARPLRLDAHGFVLGVRSLMRSREGIASLPLLLDQLLRGERVRAGRELLRLAEAGGGRPMRATFWLVRCYDEYGPAYRARLDSVRTMVWKPLRGLGDNLQDCPLWQRASASPEEGAPVASDIATLILTGEFDPRTPIEFGRRIAATLPRSHVFELPGETHGGQPTGCRAGILGRFMENPARSPDASCITDMQPIAFRTRWRER